MKWTDFVRDFKNDHPHVKWKDALKQCKGPWAEHKKRNHLQPKRRGKPHVPGMCEIKNEKIAKLSKRDRDKIKDECGIYAVRRLTPKKKVRFKPMKQKKKKRGKMASS